MQTDLEKENKRLVECLRKANAQAEHFEREWYLRGDALEAAAQSLDAIARLAGKDQYLAYSTRWRTRFHADGG
ncbi:hypothetical protein, partial [Diaphorobacter sp. J5-51]|uniref:hypothetical protein n=1 Tax=Diaphorobacter sp. J5-51 TaxID=680496 RepID=UPI000642E1D2